MTAWKNTGTSPWGWPLTQTFQAGGLDPQAVDFGRHTTEGLPQL